MSRATLANGHPG